MKKALVGLTAVAALVTSFAVVAPTPASAERQGWKKDRHHYSYRHRHHRRHDDGVRLRFGSPGGYYCTTYWRHGHRYRHCEPRGGLTLNFRF